jgi:hypothetical protein
VICLASLLLADDLHTRARDVRKIVFRSGRFCPLVDLLKVCGNRIGSGCRRQLLL